MNTPRLIIVTSLALNAVLLGIIVFRPRSSPLSQYNQSVDAANLSAPRTANAAPKAADRESRSATLPASAVLPSPGAPPSETWARIQSHDLAVFAANLRAAGLPERQLRMLVNAEINDRFRAREEAVRPPRPPRNFWEEGNTHHNDPTTLEQRLAQLDLRREKAALRRELLGEAPHDPNDTHPIPREKRDLLREINEDYNTMISQIQRETRGVTLASDEEKLRYLRAEKDAELKAALSPAEYREYEIRSSPTAGRLRSELAAFGPDEQEFRTVFALRKQFDDQFANTPPNADAAYWKERRDAQAALDAQITQQLGPDRGLDYLRSKDHDFRSLAALTERLGLPRTAANQVYDLRYTVPTDALQIVRNPSLSPDVKQESLQVIAEQTRAQLTAQLGAEAAEAYLRRHGQWIKALERGQVIEHKPDGTRQTHTVPRP